MSKLKQPAPPSLLPLASLVALLALPALGLAFAPPPPTTAPIGGGGGGDTTRAQQASPAPATLQKRTETKPATSITQKSPAPTVRPLLVAPATAPVTAARTPAAVAIKPARPTVEPSAARRTQSSAVPAPQSVTAAPSASQATLTAQRLALQAQMLALTAEQLADQAQVQAANAGTPADVQRARATAVAAQAAAQRAAMAAAQRIPTGPPVAIRTPQAARQLATNAAIAPPPRTSSTPNPTLRWVTLEAPASEGPSLVSIAGPHTLTTPLVSANASPRSAPETAGDWLAGGLATAAALHGAIAVRDWSLAERQSLALKDIFNRLAAPTHYSPGLTARVHALKRLTLAVDTAVANRDAQRANDAAFRVVSRFINTQVLVAAALSGGGGGGLESPVAPATTRASLPVDALRQGYPVVMRAHAAVLRGDVVEAKNQLAVVRSQLEQALQSGVPVRESAWAHSPTA